MIRRQRRLELRDAGVGDGDGVEIPCPVEGLAEPGDKRDAAKETRLSPSRKRRCGTAPNAVAKETALSMKESEPR